jgi:hypothetical protein
MKLIALAALATVLTLFSVISSAQIFGMKSGKDQMKEYTNAVEDALSKGKSVVIVPLFNERNRYVGYRKGGDDYSLVVFWQNTGSPSPNAGFQSGPDASLFNVEAGEVYQVSIVEPGTYGIQGSFYSEQDTSLASLKTTDAPPKSRGLGRVLYAPGGYNDFKLGQEWRAAEFETHTLHDSYCTMVHVASGACVSWGTVSRDVTTMKNPEGYYGTATKVVKPEVNASIRITRSFATFQAAPGEVVLVDGFFARVPNLVFDKDSCKHAERDAVECDLKQFQLNRIRPSVDAFRQELKDAKTSARPFDVTDVFYEGNNIPLNRKMRAVLSKAVYREPVVTARSAGKDPDWGEALFLDADPKT